MTTGIYGIWDKKDNKCLYIGQSSNIEDRWKNHIKKLRGGRALKVFQDWFDLTGRDENRLKFGILQRCSDVDKVKNELEMLWFRGFSPEFFGKEPSINETWEMTFYTKYSISETLIKVNLDKNFLGNYSEKVLSKDANTKIENLRVTARKEPRHELKCVACDTVFRHKIAHTKYCSVKCIPKKFPVELIPELIPEFIQMYSKGYSLRQISSEFNFSHVTIRKKLKENGVEMRSNNSYNRVN